MRIDERIVLFLNLTIFHVAILELRPVESPQSADDARILCRCRRFTSVENMFCALRVRILDLSTTAGKTICKLPGILSGDASGGLELSAVLSHVIANASSRNERPCAALRIDTRRLEEKCTDRDIEDGILKPSSLSLVSVA